MAVHDYIRQRFFPHMWCPGCGHGIVLNALLHAVDGMGLDKKDLVMVSGIGCSARISGYVDFHSLHTLHGRALAFATGLKLSKPELRVIVPMGDGDALAIGGNHFIHAARRNIDLTAIVMNNRIYGMTGGQFSPLSGPGQFDHVEVAVDVPVRRGGGQDARAAGASFVARTTAYHVHEAIDLLTRAIAHKGFSVVEILSQCPTYFGRKNKLGEAAEMLVQYRTTTARLGSRRLAEQPGLIARGVFVETQRPEYCQSYDQVMARAMGEAER